MTSSDFLLPLGIGLLVMCAVYIGLRRGFGSRDPTIRRAVAVFSAVAGVVVTLFLQEHPDMLEQQSITIVLALTGVVLALIATIRRKLR